MCSWAVICQYNHRMGLFSPCIDLSHEQQDLQHFMLEQIDLHIF